MTEKLHNFSGLGLSLTEKGVSAEPGAVHWWNTITQREKCTEYLREMTPELRAEIIEAREFIREHFPNIEERAKARRADADQALRDLGIID